MDVMFQAILLERSGDIQTLIFNRPEELNTITDKLIKEVNTTFKQIRKDKEVRVLIITGTGKAFMAGADLRFVQNYNVM